MAALSTTSKPQPDKKVKYKERRRKVYKWGMFHNDSEKVKCVHLFLKLTLFSPKYSF